MSLTEHPWKEGSSPNASAEELTERVESDPVEARAAVEELVELVRTGDEAERAEADDALDHIGDRAPQAFEACVDRLAGLAADDDEEIAFVGLRALAQLAAENKIAVRPAVQPAFGHLDAESPDTRAAALAVIAEVGGEYPTVVTDLDGRLATAFDDPAPVVRSAAVLTAGRVLPAASRALPKTATGLLEMTDDRSPDVRKQAHWAIAHIAIERPEAVPEPKRAVQALTDVTDADLELKEGTVAKAISGLVDGMVP